MEVLQKLHVASVSYQSFKLVEKSGNAQGLHYGIMSKWTRISKECFHHLVESIPRRIEAVLRGKAGPTRHLYSVYSEVLIGCR